jgi:hypothetical protein
MRHTWRSGVQKQRRLGRVCLSSFADSPQCPTSLVAAGGVNDAGRPVRLRAAARGRLRPAAASWMRTAARSTDPRNMTARLSRDLKQARARQRSRGEQMFVDSAHPVGSGFPTSAPCCRKGAGRSAHVRRCGSQFFYIAVTAPTIGFGIYSGSAAKRMRRRAAPCCRTARDESKHLPGQS